MTLKEQNILEGACSAAVQVLTENWEKISALHKLSGNGRINIDINLGVDDEPIRHTRGNNSYHPPRIWPNITYKIPTATHTIAPREVDVNQTEFRFTPPLPPVTALVNRRSIE